MNTRYYKYEDNFFIEKYAALWAYGYINGLGYSDGLYRTISDLATTVLDKEGKHQILDVGCGVGRTASDCARNYPNSKIVAIDSAPLMIEYAKKIVVSKIRTKFNLSRIGFPDLYLEGFGLENIVFQESNLEQFYADNKDMRFDLITSVNFIDRVIDLDGTLKILYSLLNEGGNCILSSPLNFQDASHWDNYGSADKMKKALVKVGFKVDHSVDNLIYQEILDARGAVEQYPTLVMKLSKPH